MSLLEKFTADSHEEPWIFLVLKKNLATIYEVWKSKYQKAF